MELQIKNRPSLYEASNYTDEIPFTKSKEGNGSTSTEKPFIQANTVDITYEEIKENHIIPVFIRDNEPLISHVDFIEATAQITSEVFHNEIILKPNIRVSHPIKGRIPEAKNKSANELLDNEKTIYFERMAFIIEVPSIYDEVDGHTLSLTIGGVKAYSLDNIYSKKGSDEHFKVFIGFQNKVCTNLCVWTDGFSNDLKVNSINQLKACIHYLLENYNAAFHLHGLKALRDYSLTEKQFAQLIGKCRMYQHLPKDLQSNIPQLMFGDNQINAVCKDYYKDSSFCRDDEGNINLWRLYNLFTGANKNTYIDGFIEKSVNAFHFVNEIKWALENKKNNWFFGD
ncbi:MAG: DUF3871 family protein [Flavisolibacter sp.]